MKYVAAAKLVIVVFSFVVFGVSSLHARINEVRISDDGREYFEIRGPAGLDLAPFHYLVIGDGEGGNSGVIETAIPLQGVVPEDGIYLAAASRFRHR